METAAEITGLLRQAEAGDQAAHAQVLPLIYAELKKVARAVRGGGHDPILDTTALVHEAYLRLIGVDELEWPDRHRFFSYAAQVMRTILVDEARRNLALKRAGDQRRVEFDEGMLVSVDFPATLLEVDAALARIEKIDPRLFHVIELHVFAGLEFADIARCLQIGERSVYRLWHKARTLLQGLLQADV